MSARSSRSGLLQQKWCESNTQRHARARVEFEHVGGAVGDVVVLQHQPPLRRFGQRLVTGRPTVHRGGLVAVHAADVHDDDSPPARPPSCRGSSPGFRCPSTLLRFNSGSGLLRIVYCDGWNDSRSPMSRARGPARAIPPRFLHLSVELRHVRVGHIRRDVRRHAVHRDPLLFEVAKTPCRYSMDLSR